MSRLAKRVRADHVLTSAALRARPGVWLVVADYRSPNSAESISHSIRYGRPIGGKHKGAPYAPAGAFEARLELIEDGTRVLARYVGEEASQ